MVTLILLALLKEATKSTQSMLLKKLMKSFMMNGSPMLVKYTLLETLTTGMLKNINLESMTLAGGVSSCLQGKMKMEIKDH